MPGSSTIVLLCESIELLYYKNLFSCDRRAFLYWNLLGVWSPCHAKYNLVADLLMSKYNSVHLLIVDFVDTNVLSSLVCKYVFAYFVSFFITSVK